jgi:sugar phosphate isomerase/epimerase
MGNMAHGGNEFGLCGTHLPFSDLNDLADQARRLGVSNLLIPLDKFIADPPNPDRLNTLARVGVHIAAGEIRLPDETQMPGFSNTGKWELRRQKLVQACQLALAMKIPMVTTHLGLIPPGNHEDYPLWVGHLKDWAPTLAEAGLLLLIQAGHQPAQELLLFLNDLGKTNIYADFNPATWLINGTGDPVEAASILGRHIRLARLADAVLSSQPGVIPGVERPLGQGQLRVDEYLLTLQQSQYDQPLFLQASSGDDPFKRLEDMIAYMADPPADETMEP